MNNISQIAFFLIIIACAGFIGVWVGQSTLTPKAPINESSNDLHDLFHNKLNINKEQERQFTNIEKDFKHLKTLYEGQMKTANLELAQAITEDGYSSDKIETIIHKIHKAMGSLQTLSLKHLADMQKILNKEQNKKLQEMVVEQLRRNAGE